MFQNFVCRIFGHNWRFKDTTLWIKVNGERYSHTKTRRCVRCDQRDYLYEDWIPEEKVSANDKESII
jgi:hypothetical protein